MNTWIERLTPLRGDLYLLQRRPGHPQVLLNDDYRGLLRLDPWRGATLARHPYSPRFRQQGGAVGPLYLRDDGRGALAAAWDGGDAALLDLEDGQARDLDFPIPGGERSLRYLWDARALVCADLNGERFFSLHSDGALHKVNSLALRKEHPAWRRALHTYTSPHGRVLRVYNDARAMITLQRMHPNHPPRVVYADWQREDAWETLAARGVDDAAGLPDDLFLLAEDTIWRHRRGHDPAPFLRPEPGWELRAVEALPPHGGRPAALVTLQRRRVHLLDLRLVLTPLEGRPDLSATGAHPARILGESFAALAEALRELTRRPDATAALFLHNTAHPLFDADRDALARALRDAWPQAHDAHSSPRALRLFNGQGAHDFDVDALRLAR